MIHSTGIPGCIMIPFITIPGTLAHPGLFPGTWVGDIHITDGAILILVTDTRITVTAAGDTHITAMDTHTIGAEVITADIR